MEYANMINADNHIGNLYKLPEGAYERIFGKESTK